MNYFKCIIILSMRENVAVTFVILINMQTESWMPTLAHTDPDFVVPTEHTVPTGGGWLHTPSLQSHTKLSRHGTSKHWSGSLLHCTCLWMSSWGKKNWSLAMFSSTLVHGFLLWQLNNCSLLEVHRNPNRDLEQKFKIILNWSMVCWRTLYLRIARELLTYVKIIEQYVGIITCRKWIASHLEYDSATILNPTTRNRHGAQLLSDALPRVLTKNSWQVTICDSSDTAKQLALSDSTFVATQLFIYLFWGE